MGKIHKQEFGRKKPNNRGKDKKTGKIKFLQIASWDLLGALFELLCFLYAVEPDNLQFIFSLPSLVRKNPNIGLVGCSAN
jgi:hypothetical protein